MFRLTPNNISSITFFDLRSIKEVTGRCSCSFKLLYFLDGGQPPDPQSGRETLSLLNGGAAPPPHPPALNKVLTSLRGCINLTNLACCYLWTGGLSVCPSVFFLSEYCRIYDYC